MEVLVRVGISVATGLISRALTPKPVEARDAIPVNEIKPAEPNEFREIAVRQSVPPRRFVYGSCRVGGAVIFEENSNPYLYVAAALSDGLIHAIDGVWFGTQKISLAAESPAGQAEAAGGTKHYSKYKLSYRLGTTTQAADAMLTADVPTLLPADFWQRGVACAVSRLHWGDNSEQHGALWGQSVSPAYDVRGVRAYDPRNGAHSPTNPATWAYTDNPVLCVLHALTNAWNIKIAHSSVDMASVIAAADICDALITYNSASVKTFTLAGVFQSETDMASQLTKMLGSFGGAITYSGGAYKIHADAARSPVWTITDDDILELGEYQHSVEAGQRFNVISASFSNADDSGLTNVTTPYVDPAESSEGTRETSIDLPFTPKSHSAQILAYRALKKMRNGRQLTVRVHDAGLYLDAFEVVTVASTEFPACNGTYEVLQVDMAEEGAQLTLTEYVSAAYASPSGYLV